MGLNDKITERFEVMTNVSTHDLLQKISDGKQKQTWKDFLITDAIDYKELKLSNGRLEIIRAPSFFNPFRPDGSITIDLNDVDEKKTKLKCEIIPFNGNLPIFIWIPIGALTLWSLAVLLFSRGIIAFIMIFSAWTMCGLIIYLFYLYNKHGLIGYSKRIIKELTLDKKAC